MLDARDGLREIYARALMSQSIEDTLLEMKRRGLPDELYQQYLNEAKDIGLIPVPGRSRIGGKILTEDDILRVEDILKPVSGKFNSNRYWYGIG